MKTNNDMYKGTSVDLYTRAEIDEKLKHIVTNPVFLPSQTGRLLYTGEELTPTWDNYDSSKLKIGGTTSGTDIGTYKATFTPKFGYTWADGTTDTKITTWKISPNIYGAIWDGTSTTAWTRTDGAEFFEDPVPYVEGATEYGSPFDNIYPWSDIKRVTDDVAGELVAIPKFWYKWTQSGDTLKLQISPEARNGFYVSPAHADRGDGNGEHDVVYVGRYHCANATALSQTKWTPLTIVRRSDARSGIASLGKGIYQWDMAMLVTIQMLYLVEYADWDSQAKIGYGCAAALYETQDVEYMGSTDSMPYHTGTMQSSRDTYGVGVQYRYIEDLWANCCDWLDGCYYGDSGLYVVKNPANFSDDSNGTLIGEPVVNCYPSKMSVSTVSGFEWVIYPTEGNGSNTTYISDSWVFDSSSPCLFIGASWGTCSRQMGLFHVATTASDVYASNIGTRLMKLP